ncbi:hypothetical protein BJV82DRAFT_55516 [Fennellomyces sp. T-0311]|nr:hypothetical protein BJV82DRAFT_55516 [Fennellomyces sp. T-0311]
MVINLQGHRAEINFLFTSQVHYTHVYPFRTFSFIFSRCTISCLYLFSVSSLVIFSLIYLNVLRLNWSYFPSLSPYIVCSCSLLSTVKLVQFWRFLQQTIIIPKHPYRGRGNTVSPKK